MTIIIGPPPGLVHEYLHNVADPTADSVGAIPLVLGAGATAIPSFDPSYGEALQMVTGGSSTIVMPDTDLLPNADWTIDTYFTVNTGGARFIEVHSEAGNEILEVYKLIGNPGALTISVNLDAPTRIRQHLITTNPVVFENTWYHLMIYSISANKRTYCYIDGVYQGSSGLTDLNPYASYVGDREFNFSANGGTLARYDATRFWTVAKDAAYALERTAAAQESYNVAYTDSAAQVLGVFQESLRNDVLKLTHPDGYDFYVRGGNVGKEQLSKAGTHTKSINAYFDNALGTGTKYVAASTPTNTLLRIAGEHDLKVYEVTGMEEEKTGMYIKRSIGVYKLIGNVKVKSITEVNQAITFPLALPLVAP